MTLNPVTNHLGGVVKNLSLKDMLVELRTHTTVSVPFAGKALGGLSKTKSYEAAKADKLGVPVINVGGGEKRPGKIRVPSALVLKRLGLDE